MAIRTISATGGNYNATTTWDEGIVPTSSDEIVGNGSSGNLTINVASSARELRLSDYTGVIALNSSLQVNASSVTHSFSPTMSFTRTTGSLNMSGTFNFTTNGVSIPRLQTNGAMTTTLVGDLNVDILALENVNTWNCLGGTVSVSALGTGGLTAVSIQALNNMNLVIAGTAYVTNFRSTMTNCRLTFNAGTSTFNTTLNGPTLTGVTVSHVSGDIINGNFRIAGGSTNNFDTSSVTWSSVTCHAGSGEMNTVRSISQLKINNLFVAANNGAMSANPHGISFTGTVSGINVNEVTIIPSIVQDNGRPSRQAPTLRLQTGVTHSFGSIFCNGLDNPNPNASGSTNSFCRIDSTSPGTQSGLNITGTQSISRTWIRDINAETTIYVLGGTTSNTTNVNVIDQYYYTQGGGGEVSYTFVN